MLRRWLGSLCMMVICGSLLTGCRALRSYPEQLKLTRGQMIEHLQAGFASEDPNLYWLLFDVSENQSNYCQLGVLARHLTRGGPVDLEEVNIQGTHSSDGKSLRLADEDGGVCLLSERGWEVRRLSRGEQLNDRNDVGARAYGAPGRADGTSLDFLSSGTITSGTFSVDNACRFVHAKERDRVVIYELRPGLPARLVESRVEAWWGYARRGCPTIFSTPTRVYEITFAGHHHPAIRIYRINDAGLDLERVVEIDLTRDADRYGACHALDFNPRNEELLMENERDLSPDEFLVCSLRDGSVKKLDTRDGFPLGYLDRDIFRWDEAVLADTPVPFAAESMSSGSAGREAP